MPQRISLGAQDFEYIRSNHCFYVDKTCFIKEWWENRDVVTLITRPRRFGKTLNMCMLEQFSRCSIRAGQIFLKDWIFGKRNHTGISREPGR